MPIDRLPRNLTHVAFGTNFNQALDQMPQRLQQLILTREYAREIPIFLQSICVGNTAKVILQ